MCRRSEELIEELFSNVGLDVCLAADSEVRRVEERREGQAPPLQVAWEGLWLLVLDRKGR